jgi:hypothetical protein
MFICLWHLIILGKSAKVASAPSMIEAGPGDAALDGENRLVDKIALGSRVI